MFQSIQPSQQLGHRQIKLRRDLLIEFDLHEQPDQIFRFVHIDIILSGALDYRLGDQATPFGNHLRRPRLVFAVGQGDGYLLRREIVLLHDFSTTAAAS